MTLPFHTLVAKAQDERRVALLDTRDAARFNERGEDYEAEKSEAWARQHWRNARLYLRKAREARNEELIRWTRDRQGNEAADALVELMETR